MNFCRNFSGSWSTSAPAEGRWPPSPSLYSNDQSIGCLGKLYELPGKKLECFIKKEDNLPFQD